MDEEWSGRSKEKWCTQTNAVVVTGSFGQGAGGVVTFSVGGVASLAEGSIIKLNSLNVTVSSR